ncbi:MAG: hypothetical protein AAGJ29_11360 [Pseudomonadota bacterium]
MGLVRVTSFLSALGCIALLGPLANADVVDNPRFDIEGLVIVWGANDQNNAPVVADFVIDDGAGAADTDLIADDAFTVVTGTLVATRDAVATSDTVRGIPFVIEDTASGTINTDTNSDGFVAADDAFSPFGLLDPSDARVDATQTLTSFYVASNTPFAINAEARLASFGDLVLLSNITWDMAVTLSGDDGVAFGSAAQFPHSAGADGGVATFANLIPLAFGQTVFTGNQATAAQSGSIADQSVRFDISYAIGAGALTGYDLSLGTFDFEIEVTYTVFVP